MIWALLALVATLVASNITTVVWWRGESKSKEHLRDLVDQWKSSTLSLQGDLDLERKNMKVKTDELAETKKLLAITQRQRNESMETARDYFVQRISSAGIADAAKLVTDLVALDLRPGADGVLPPRRSEDPKDYLLPID